MLKRRQIRAIRRFIQKLVKTTGKISLSVLNNMIRTLVRSLFVTTRHRQRRTAAQTGFVLPTVALLLVVVALVIGAILFRTGSRTNQVIAERQQQIIYNSATPAIDRGKAKLEYLFKRDSRLPNTVPSEDQLMSALMNDGKNEIVALPNNPYKFPDEKEYLDINNDGTKDPAWTYEIDTDGDKTPDTTVAYSITFKSTNPDDKDKDPRINLKDEEKAKKLFVRNGPITVREAARIECKRLNTAPEKGWDLVSQAALRKTFQVDAVVVSNKAGNRTVTTLEFQQDRELARANKWGAWFRYDMHLYPNPEFKWNGAMHTEGSLYLGGANSNSVQNFLISAPASCLYDPGSNSEISIGRVRDAEDSKIISFAGQVINGTISGSEFSSAAVHIFGKPKPTYEPLEKVEIKAGNDSLKDDTTDGRAAVALDPVILFTEDQSKALGRASNVDKSDTNSDWIDKERLKANSRIIAKTEKPPYVDDTYRADDRLGPKPKFDLEGLDNDFMLDKSKGLTNGVSIATASLNSAQKDQLINNSPPSNDEELRTLGLDGYWERRARKEGMRIIVGQRLELGNPYGWKNIDLDNDGTIEPNERDPLYPIYKSGLTSPISHQQQQRRTLRDNLAAVQATAVYHWKKEDGYVPVACVATTAHPGTQTTTDNNTIYNSTNFSLAKNYYASYSGKPYDLISDFFTGLGTNGWEFSVPSSGDFTSDPLKKALQNLANFAGDYENKDKSGAFPPTQKDGEVHPDPYRAMWGNFSNLRRALSSDGNNSIADRSYMHTAGCAVGMLAYNIKYFQDYKYDDQTKLDDLNTALKADFGLGAGKGLAAGKTPDDYINKLSGDNQKLARLISQKEQIARDRRFGFAASPGSQLVGSTFSLPAQDKVYQYEVKQHDEDASTSLPSFEYGGVKYDKNATAGTKKTVDVGCDFSNSTGNNYFGFGDPASALSDADKQLAEKRFIRLAVSLCPTQPKFPSLYYIFPATPSDHNRKDNQPDTEPYIKEALDLPGDFRKIEDSEINSLADKFKPKDGSWVLPKDGSATSGDSSNAFKIKDTNNNDLYVPFVDKGIFDGREMMSTRVLDIDLERLRKNSVDGETWFPKSGVFYAFREDAVREDAIARPQDGNNPTNATNPESPKDPKVIDDNGISFKPVDFYADPDRRSYGFRLRNGVELKRETDNPRGITFVSDNLVAIQGDFNKHTKQEFSDDKAFYDRVTLDEGFASLNNDNWRPAEILADGITLLSNNFVDGNIESGLREDKEHSYRGLGDVDNGKNWIREDGSLANGNAPSPIKIARDGNIFTCNSTTTPCPATDITTYSFNVDFGDTNRRENLNDGVETEINAILVSGIVPARKHQGNGGFHNFPRLLENWNGKPLKIAGSFLQLNFSTSATGPFEQDAWEPGATPVQNDSSGGGENAFHYRPPNRVWGYDVGLQYAPAGPLSKRFITAESPRSEFYEEPKANDPYICLLRKAIAGKGQRTETSAQVDNECSK